MKINDLNEDLGNWIARKGFLGAQAGMLANREYNKNLASQTISKEFITDFQRNFDNAVKSGIVDVKATLPAPPTPEEQAAAKKAEAEKASAAQSQSEKDNIANNRKNAQAKVATAAQQQMGDFKTKTPGQNQPRTFTTPGNGQPPMPTPGANLSKPATQKSTPSNKVKPLKTVKVGNEVITKQRDGKWYDQEGAAITNKKDIRRLEQMATPAMASNFVKEGRADHSQFSKLFESAMNGETLFEQDGAMSPGEWAQQYLVSKLGNRQLPPKLKTTLDNLVKNFSTKVNSTGKFPTDVAGQMFQYLSTVASMMPATDAQQKASEPKASTPSGVDMPQEVMTQVDKAVKTIKSVDNIPGAVAYLIDIVMDSTGKSMDDVIDDVVSKVKKASDAREKAKKTAK